MLWSVSQAAPLRRLVIKNNIKLFEYKGVRSPAFCRCLGFSGDCLRDCAWLQGGAAGYASGGFLSDSVVEGLIASGSQQQVNAAQNAVACALRVYSIHRCLCFLGYILTNCL